MNPDVIADLRALKAKRTKYDLFGKSAVLNEEIGVAVYEWHHTEIVQLLLLLEICRKLKELPYPWNGYSCQKVILTALHYTGRLKIRFMIQQKKQHPDQHDAEAHSI